jgi:hypothetical protein
MSPVWPSWLSGITSSSHRLMLVLGFRKRAAGACNV